MDSWYRDVRGTDGCYGYPPRYLPARLWHLGVGVHLNQVWCHDEWGQAVYGPEWLS